MASNTSKIAPIDFTNVEPISLENFAYLTPGWYLLRISDTGYTPESINNDGKAISANIAWNLTVQEALDPDFSTAVGGKIRDNFGYGQKNNFGMGRFMGALEAIHDRKPPKAAKNLDLSEYDGRSVLCYVDDNNYEGRVSSRVQKYLNVSRAEQIRQEVLAIRAARKPATNGAAPAASLPVEHLEDA